jgi:hypothetical protein
MMPIQSNFGTAPKFPFRVDLFLQQGLLQPLRHLDPPPRLLSKSQLNPAAAHVAMARSGTASVPILTYVAPSGDIAGLVQRIVIRRPPLGPFKDQERVEMVASVTVNALIQAFAAPNGDIVVQVPTFAQLLPSLVLRQ